jgi:hypothetical protein
MMEEKLDLQALTEAGNLLNLLIDEVHIQESPLSGGEALGLGTLSLRRLKETRVTFGNPVHNLVLLTPQKLKDNGLDISDPQMRQMNTSMNGRYDFYYMTLAVSMQPAPGVQFTRLECHLDFGPKGNDEPIVHSIFPKSEWREILRVGRKLNLGLDANLQWTAGLDTPGTGVLQNLPMGVNVDISSKSDFKAYAVIPDYCYELGKTDIAATGEGNSECFWRIDKPELQKTQTVQLGIVFKTLKSVSKIELSGIVSVEPDFKWLTGNIGDVFDFLSEKLKNLLRVQDGQRKGKERLPVGRYEKWTLTLPKE